MGSMGSYWNIRATTKSISPILKFSYRNCGNFHLGTFAVDVFFNIIGFWNGIPKQTWTNTCIIIGCFTIPPNLLSLRPSTHLQTSPNRIREGSPSQWIDIRFSPNMLTILEFKLKFNSAKLFFPCFFFQIAICHSFEKKIHIPTRQIQTLQSFGLLASLTSAQLEAPIARFPKPSFVLEKQIQTRKKTKNTMIIFCYKAVGSVSFRCVTLPVED